MGQHLSRILCMKPFKQSLDPPLNTELKPLLEAHSQTDLSEEEVKECSQNLFGFFELLLTIDQQQQEKRHGLHY